MGWTASSNVTSTACLPDMCPHLSLHAEYVILSSLLSMQLRCAHKKEWAVVCQYGSGVRMCIIICFSAFAFGNWNLEGDRGGKRDKVLCAKLSEERSSEGRVRQNYKELYIFNFKQRYISLHEIHWPVQNMCCQNCFMASKHQRDDCFSHPYFLVASGLMLLP